MAKDLNAPNLIFVPYFYRVDATLAALGSATVALQLDPDADFEMHYIMGSSTQDAETNFYNNNFSVTPSDKGSSRFWSNAAIPQKVICGPDNGGLPLRRPVVIAAKSNLSFQFTDLANNGANTATIVLVGFKVINP
jgi:hypothetical protein